MSLSSPRQFKELPAWLANPKYETPDVPRKRRIIKNDYVDPIYATFNNTYDKSNSNTPASIYNPKAMAEQMQAIHNTTKNFVVNHGGNFVNEIITASEKAEELAELKHLYKTSDEHNFKQKKRGIYKSLEKKYNFFNSTMRSEKFPRSRLDSFEKPEFRHTNLSFKRPTLIKTKNSASEIMHFQQSVSKAMDMSKEKMMLEESKLKSEKTEEIENIAEGIEELRKIAQFAQNSTKTPSKTGTKSFSITPGKRVFTARGSETYKMAFDFQDQPFTSAREYKSLKTPEDTFYSSMQRADDQFIKKYSPERSKKDVKSPPNPFDALVEYQDKKMPFNLALMAKIRHKLLEDIKNNANAYSHHPERDLIEARNRIIPEEQSKFLDNMTIVDKKAQVKKMAELQSRNLFANHHYQLMSFSKVSKQRVASKLKEVLPAHSRFLKDLAPPSNRASLNKKTTN